MNPFLPLIILTITLFASCHSKPSSIASEQVTYPGATLSSLTELMDAIEVIRL